MSDKIMEQDITIQPFTNQDSNMVYAFFQRLSTETRTAFRPHPFTEETAKQLAGEDVANVETKRFAASLRIDNQDVMIGYFFFWDWHTGVPSFGIAVADSYQGMGLGWIMTSYALEFARSHGKGGVMLTTDRTNIRGQALYKKCGFEIIGHDLTGEFLLIHRYVINMCLY
ncbi:N-acetyltransferase [Paenibacillus psychroresistens]|uniref:N-acetyltransferase n=1 Tax=Paenibacillus psychroresistens TaxID=1778678 RepID=A0A6B8RS23_9BACL|nr:N-acetyltransferase [Paenibacillus psychroresistens]QGQ98048.1 N-acetyltransferase [Paenibacillus psychroresistens]